MGRQKKCHQPQKTSNVILLNKQFSGSWLDTDENIGHEIIDFLEADNKVNEEDHYVFDAPHGSCPDVFVAGEDPGEYSEGKQKKRQRYAAKYLLLTSPATINYQPRLDKNGKTELNKNGKPKKIAKGCTFDILYVVELKRKIHSFPVSNRWRGTWESGGKKKIDAEKPLFTALRNAFCSPRNDSSPGEYVPPSPKSIWQGMEKLCDDHGFRICKERKRTLVKCVQSACELYKEARDAHNEIRRITQDIKFNGKTLEEIHAGEPEDACALYLTFSVNRMFKADPPIHVTCQQFVFQRTRGRLKEFDLSKSPGNPEHYKYKEDFDRVRDQVENCIRAWERKDIHFGPKEKGRLERFYPAKANDAERFKEMPLEKTFLDLIELQDYEQAYTNMLCAVLKVGKGEMMKQFCAFVRGRHERECDAQTWKALKNWSMNAWNDCTIKVNKETPVAISEDKDTLEYGEDHSKSKSGTKGGRMDVCADILDRSGKSIQRVIIENKIDSPLNGVDEDDKITQLDTYYNQWGKLSATEPLCFVVAPTRRIDEIKREIEKNDEGKDSEEMMGNRYFLVTYGEIAEFVEQFKDMIPPKEISASFVEEIIRAFKAHSLRLEDYYAWKVWLKTSRTS